MASKLNENVNLHITLEDGTKGFIKINWNGLRIISEDGNIHSSETNRELVYFIDHRTIPSAGGTIDSVQLDEKVCVKLHPQMVNFHPYTPFVGQVVEDIFPPSSEGFYGRMKQGHQEAIYITQDIIGSAMKWLTIADPTNEIPYESHMVHPYEAESLALIESSIRQSILYRDISHDSKNPLKDMLEGPSPSWDELDRIITDISIPNLSLMNTARGTLSQLVPVSFPDVIREQLMIFLAFVIKGEIPDADPVEFQFSLLSVPLLGSLIRGHIRCMMDNFEWPPYVKLMILAERNQLDPPKRAVSEEIKATPWLMFWQKCTEFFPNWLSNSIQLADEVNRSGRLLLSLPVSKAQAKRSKTAWKKRFASSFYDFRLLGHVNTESIGLENLVYVGAAYRWPHRHMKFITRLGSTSENTPHLQVMTMPFEAAERINRVLPGVMKIGLNKRMSNLSMFDGESKRWIVPARPIIDALGRTSSKKKVHQLIGERKIAEFHTVAKQEAKVMDLVTSGISLEDLEIPKIIEYFEIDTKILKSTIKKLTRRNVIDIAYETNDDQLISLATIIQGKEDNLRSLVIAFLKHTPTSLVMVDDSYNQVVAISKMPESTAYELASSLPERGFDLGLNIRCMRPTIFKSYTHNLYQRLLKEDGTWDDNVSAFLSQARSKRKELSESNA